jgi:hypothetical protein
MNQFFWRPECQGLHRFFDDDRRRGGHNEGGRNGHFRGPM